MTSSGTAGAQPVGQSTPQQAEVLQYLDKHHINEVLNILINKLVQSQTNDPCGFLAKEFSKRASPPTITRLQGREILDSRGNPTVECDVYATVEGEEKLVSRSGAPSGASTGSNEARELRDKNANRYLGKGCLTAAENITKGLSAAVKGMDARSFKETDAAIIKADGTQLKEKVGGNAITAASFALAEAASILTRNELFVYFNAVFKGQDPSDYKPTDKLKMPRPMVNILNGGKHAGSDLQIQEFMIVPKAGLFKDTLRMCTEVYHHLGKILVDKKGPSAKNLGDEGGYAPLLSSPEETLSLIEEAVGKAGYKVGEDIFLALDCASSEFYKDGNYEVEKGKHLSTDEMIQYYLNLKSKHPALISIEDGLDEKDYVGWQKLTKTFKEKYPEFMLVGDDLYTTNTELIKKGVAEKWANALLLKVNQIGSISEAMEAAKMIFNDKGNVIVSHRSGETPSAIIADLAVGIGAQFIKTGSTARGERVAKYNRLLVIEEMLQQQGLLNVPLMRTQ